MFKRLFYFALFFLLFVFVNKQASAQFSLSTNTISSESNDLRKGMNTASNKDKITTLYSTNSMNFPICIEQQAQRNPAIAYNSKDNEYLVVWQDKRNDAAIDIFGRRFSSAGEPLGNDFPICAEPKMQAYHAVAYNSKDNEYLVVWVDHRNIVSQETQHDIYIYGQRVASHGVLIGDNFPISTFQTDCARNAAIAYCDSLNEYLVVWEVDIDLAGPPYGWIFKIRGQPVSNTGELLDNPGTSENESDPAINFSISVHERIEHQGISPDIVYNSRDNQYLVVWRDGRYYPGSQNDDIFGQILSCEGEHELPDDIPICIQHDRNGKSGQRQNRPVVAYNEIDNEYLAVWYDERNDPDRYNEPYICDIYGQQLSNEGKLIDNPDTPEDETDPTVNFPISITYDIQWCPDVVFNSNSGIYLVVWTDWRNDPGNKTNLDFYGQCVGRNGGLLGNNFVISEAEGNQGSTEHNWYAEEVGGISVAFSTDDTQYLVAWGDQRNKNITGRDIYGHTKFPPQFISPDADSTHVDSVFKYTAKAIDPEGFNISYIFQNYDTTWLDALGATISGKPPRSTENIYFNVIASDGELADTLEVNIIVTSVYKSNKIIPKELCLYQNYPNPFNPETSISYQVPKISHIRIEVFNLLGQHIRTLVDEEKAPGSYQIMWNGLDDQHHSVSSGVYLYKMQAGDFRAMKKMVLVRYFLSKIYLPESQHSGRLTHIKSHNITHK